MKLKNILRIILIFICIFGIFIMYTNIDTDVYSEEHIYNEEEQDISEILENVNRSIVGISRLKDKGDTIFVNESESKLGLGTGIIVSEDGYIISNEHVSGSKGEKCFVTTDNGKSYEGNVLWSDKDNDLSIIKINIKKLTPAELGDSNNIKLGEKVYAIGNPIGFEFQRTVTSGIISAKNRTIKFKENDEEIYMADLIQTDATINPGNSGGALINENGEIIGINSIKLDSAEGIGFAIPINLIKPIIEKYKRDGRFEEASLGVFAYDKDVIPYMDSNIKVDNGIYIINVIKNSQADKNDIRVGDIITKINDKEISKMNDLKEIIYMLSPGDIVKLEIKRGINVINKEIALGEKVWWRYLLIFYFLADLILGEEKVCKVFQRTNKTRYVKQKCKKIRNM